MPDNQQTLVNNIVYLASLVSDATHIEAWLDPMRRITARHDTLSPGDKQTLLDLQSQLKNYLVRDDPLRRFEPDVLEQKMYENLQGQQHYSRLRVLVAVIAGLSISTGVGTAILTHINGVTTIPQLPFLVGFITFCLGAIFLMAQAARTFNQQLRRMYVMLCCVLALTAILIGQFSFFGILQDTWWAKTWAFSALDAGIGVFLYLAFRTLAQQLHVTSIFMSKKGIAAIVAATLGASVLLPHTPAGLPEPIYDASIMGVALLMVFSTISVVLGLAAVRKVSALYKKAVWCLIIAAGAMAAGGLVLLVIRLVWLTTGQAPFAMSLGTMLASVIGGVTFLYASYVFNKTSRH